MKIIISEAQFTKLLEFDYESDLEHQDELEKTGFWGKAGAGCIIMAYDTKRFLLPKRSDEVQEPHTWGTWGGAIDYDENPENSARREASEETGYSDEMQLYKLYIFRDPSSGFRYYNYLAIVPHEFHPRLNWESEDARWFEFNNFPSNLHFGLQDLLRNSNARNIIRQAINYHG